MKTIKTHLPAVLVMTIGVALGITLANTVIVPMIDKMKLKAANK